MKAYWIESEHQRVTRVDYEGLADLQRMVGGYIETAHRFSNGDVIYVDEEGLLKSPRYFFTIPGGHQPFAGNGVMVGREYDPDSARTRDPRILLRHLQACIRFGRR